MSEHQSDERRANVASRLSKVHTKDKIRKARILRTLLDHGQLSLTELGRITGMSVPMVSRIVDGLKREHYVLSSEDKGAIHAGRPPIIGRLNGNAGYVLGIDMGRLNTNLVLLNLEQSIVGELHLRLLGRAGKILLQSPDLP